ncbi:hypothetical protein FSST1_011385 [Fusarium sambucinum]
MLDEEIFTVQDVPLKGKGLVAATRILKEFRIFTESPLIEVPREAPSHEVLHQIIIGQLAKLSEAQKKSFYSLLNSHPDLGQEVGIAETNGLCPGPDAKNGAIFRTTSRINHSCNPNAQTQWNEDSKTIDVYATEYIEQGQEITITYLGEPLLAYEQRQKKLKDAFNFDCYCRLCYLSPAARDIANLRNTTRFPLFSGLPNSIRMGPQGLSSPGRMNINIDDIRLNSDPLVFLGEITHIEDFRPMRFTVKDKSGLEILFSPTESRDQEIDASIRAVAYNTRIGGRQIDNSKPRVGSTVVMLYATKHVPMDGNMGGIHGDPGQLRILPTSLKGLLDLNDKVQEYSVAHNQTRKCHGCEKESDSLKKCSKCGFFWYCNQDCQARRWNMYEHRNDCGLLRNENVKGLFLVKWNELKTGVSFPLSV